MSPLIRIWMLPLPLLCFVLFPSMVSAQAKIRDSSRYDVAGPFTIEITLNAKSRDALEAKIRGFLWNHWHQQLLGQVTVTYFSKESNPSKVSYFVEPSEKGQWHVAVMIDRSIFDRRSKTRHPISVAYEASSLERIEIPKNGFSNRVEISEEAKRPPRSYRLVLSDETGKTLTQL